MIDSTPLTRDILEALAVGPIDMSTRARLATAAIDWAGEIDRRVFTFEFLKEEPIWKDRGRAGRARRALHEPRLRDMLMTVVPLKVPGDRRRGRADDGA